MGFTLADVKAKPRIVNPDTTARALGWIGPDYDYRYIGKLDNRGHGGDGGKLPWHPTFSKGSVYSEGNVIGGDWVDGGFVPSLWMLQSGNTKGLADYMKEVEPGLRLFIPPPARTDWAKVLLQ